MKKKILIIDDEELVVKSVQKLLSREGYVVVICRSGDEAIHCVTSESPDLIVCDIRMPGLDGIGTIKKIREMRQIQEQKAIPEILITGYADEIATAEAEKLKVSNYLYKPFDLRVFLSAVKSSFGDVE